MAQQDASDPRTGDDTERADDIDASDVLAAFNAEEVVEQPGHPPRGPESPAADSDIQAPPG